MAVAGSDCKQITLIITEQHCKKAFVNEDINSLVNSGEIPNIFTEEDFIPLMDKLRKVAKRN